jgi:hypothetical protein
MMKVIYIFLGLILFSCTGGLEPHDGTIPKSYFAGKITYKGGKESWPNKDSVLAIRVVAFKVYPPKDIITEIASGNAFYTLLSLPLFVDSSSYRIDIPNPPVEIKYIAVALQYTSDLLSQMAVGVYAVNGNKNEPSSLLITRGKFFDNVDIEVDFKNLPPQPFK